jgi:hypothetical protein
MYLLWSLILTLLACTAGQDDPPEAETSVDFSERSVVSECGGFAAADDDTGLEVCSDERLLWSYDAASKTVDFVNEGVWLNCCGSHSIAVFMEAGGVYVLSETDEPDEGDDRCLCMCFFDYGVSLPDISVGTLALRLVRHIPDNEPSSWSVWEGSIDLSLGSGEVLIEESVGSGCD